MDLGAEQKAQQSYVKKENARFKGLLRHAKKGKIKPGLTKKEILNRYGAPVLDEDNTFLYRGPVAFFDEPKVYLVFDEKDILKEVRIVNNAG